MAFTYPASLPKPQRFGKLNIPPVSEPIPVLGGRAIRKRRRKKYLITQAIEFKFSEAQFNTWALFVRDTIEFTGAFALRTFGPDGIKDRNVYLKDGKYDYVPLGNGPILVKALIYWEQSTILPPAVDVVDGGDTSSTHSDFIDAGDTSSTHADEVDGGVV